MVITTQRVMLLLCMLSCIAFCNAKRDVMIWSACDPATMADFAKVRRSYTILSPFNSDVHRYTDGSIGIRTSPGNVSTLENCGKEIPNPNPNPNPDYNRDPNPNPNPN